MAHQVEWRTALVADLSSCPSPHVELLTTVSFSSQISFLALVMFMYPYRYNFK